MRGGKMYYAHQTAVYCTAPDGSHCNAFLPRDAMHKRGLFRHAASVCESVCLSRSWIVSKLINMSSKLFTVGYTHHSSFFHAKRHSNTPTGTPLTAASNAGGVGRNRDSEPISDLCLLLALQQARCCQQGRRWTTATVSQVMTHRW